MSEKRPAFQWYPKDYLTDENVVLMTLEEEGAYRRLIDYCWLHGSLPDNTERLAPLCKIDGSRMALLWPAIEPCFRQDPKDANRLIHPRLELERKKQDEHRKQKSRAGKAGADARWHKEPNGTAIVLPLAENGSSSAFASSSASATTVTKKKQEKLPCAVKPKKNTYPDEFEDFWTTYPKRSNPGSKAKACQRWKKAAAEVSAETLQAKAGEYAAWCQLEGIVGSGKVAMATTWLNGKRWEVELDTDPLSEGDRKVLRTVTALDGLDLETAFR